MDNLLKRSLQVKGRSSALSRPTSHPEHIFLIKSLNVLDYYTKQRPIA